MPKKVFISHAHDDKALADAVSELVRHVFDGLCYVRHDRV
jgi:hypothetical protein